MNDHIGDWYEWKRQLAVEWRKERDCVRDLLDNTTTDLPSDRVRREVLERRLRLAERELEAAQYVGD